MTLRTDFGHLPASIQHELEQVTWMVFEAFAECCKGRLSQQYREGRILAVILHGPYAEQAWEEVPPGAAFRLMLIVNHVRLVRSDQDWRLVRDRLRRAWEHGEIARPVRITVESLDRINSALADGVPHFVTIAEQGTALHQAEGLRLKAPRHLAIEEKARRGRMEFARWHKNGCDFLAGASFYRDKGNMRMAALLLHQSCEHLYQSILWSFTLHGPRTHALDELREAAESLAPNLRAAWPREDRHQRRAFGCIRRAYVEARYKRSYRITPAELVWALERGEALKQLTAQSWRDHYASLANQHQLTASEPPPQSLILTPNSHALPVLLPAALGARRYRSPSARLRRLFHAVECSDAIGRWIRRTSLFSAGICLFFAGAEAMHWRLRADPAIPSEPAKPTAILDFDIRAETVLQAVGAVANRAGYRIAANEDIWTVRWTGTYRAKATTFDALADILYGSGLCPTIKDDLITVRFCDPSGRFVIASADEVVQPVEQASMTIYRSR
ncbi:HEPN domain-containing protein [Sphingobium sp. YR657]|uniref:HEPN domain-containing protein n=1 Tax=Sphingobium sp. YR657 TaxID=1884366 RepID=UPI00091D681C|nr:HEPN domain-containing protein [Sphingobium sp. YR657]SHM72704.1 HEPN domain-containing protein [Sphingobium sp. YR657]